MKFNCWKNIDIITKFETHKKKIEVAEGDLEGKEQGISFSSPMCPKHACRPEHSYVPV